MVWWPCTELQFLYLMDETLKPKSGQFIFIPPLGRKLESDLIAGFWHVPSRSIIVGHQSVVGSPSFPAFHMHILLCSFPGKQSSWGARWTVLADLTSGCYCCCCFPFFRKTGLTESMTYFGIAGHKPSFTSEPHSSQIAGLPQWLERHRLIGRSL